MGPNACVLGRRVPHLRRWKSWGAGFPALTRWANVWRASGAPDPIRTVYSECIYLHSNHSMLSSVVSATPHARGALLYDSLPSFLPPLAGTNTFLSRPCTLFAQSAFFVPFVFNHLRTLLHTSFFSTPFFSTVCALFAQKQGGTPSICVRTLPAMRRALSIATSRLQISAFSVRVFEPSVCFQRLAHSVQKTGGRGWVHDSRNGTRNSGADGLRRPPVQERRGIPRVELGMTE